MAKLGQIVTNENLDIEQIPESEIGTMSVELTDIQSDNNSEVDVIEGTSAGIDDAETAVDQITEVQDSIGDADEPLSPTEISVVESFHSSIIFSLGLDPVRVTNESNGTLTRKDLIATLEEQKQGIGSKILAGIKHAIDIVVQFLSKLFKSKALLGRYIDSLIQKVNAGSEVTTGEGAVKSGFADAKTAQKALDACNGLVASSDKTVGNLRRLEEMVKKSPDEQSAEQYMEFASILMDGLATGEGTIMAGGGPLKFEGFDGKPDANGNRVRINITAAPSSPLVTEGKRLSKNEQLSLLNAAKAALGNLSKMEKVGNAIINFGKVLIDAFKGGHHLGKASRDSTPEADKGAHALKGAGRLALMVFRSVAMMFGATVPNIVFKNIKAAADYAKASVA